MSDIGTYLESELGLSHPLTLVYSAASSGGNGLSKCVSVSVNLDKCSFEGRRKLTLSRRPNRLAISGIASKQEVTTVEHRIANKAIIAPLRQRLGEESN